MSDLRAVLERVGGRIGPRDDAFERLERARRRRRRNRRITAGLVAAVVALAGVGGAVVAFRGGVAIEPGGGGGRVVALWPEQTMAEIERTQAAVDAGDQELQWRLDPEATAKRFADEVLGWADPMVSISYIPGPPQGVVAEIATPPAPCPPPAEGEPMDPGCFPRKVEVSLHGFVPPEGVWSVLNAASDRIRFDLETAGDLSIGETVRAHVDLLDGAQAVGGGTFFGDGCQAVFSTAHLTGSGTLELSVPSGDCDAASGYFFVYTVGPGSPAFDRDPGDGEELFAADPFDGRSLLVLDLAAIPIVVDASEAGPVPVGAETYADPTYGWRLEVPDVRRAKEVVTGEEAALWVGNFEVEGMFEGVLRAFPPDGVMYRIWHNSRSLGFPIGDDARFPLSLEDFEQIEPYVGGAEPAPFYLAFLGNGVDFNAAVWIGPDASAEDRRAIGDVVASLRFPGLESFTTTGDRYLVLDVADAYAEGSVVRYARSDLPIDDDPLFHGYQGAFSFYLVRGSRGFYGVTTDFLGNGQACSLVFDAHEESFFCADDPDPHWDVRGRSGEGGFDDLIVLPVHVAHDGHVLVDPFANAPEEAERAWK